VDGIINLNKPLGITSAKAVYRVRAITRQRHSGHAGTLDPGATGVLVVCLGKATKLVERVMDQPKVYRATARLDATSESFDADRPMTAVDVSAAPTMEEVRSACASFEGMIEQVPPRISAVKVDGVRAYKRAFRGEAMEMAPRSVRIHRINVEHYAWPEIRFDVSCGRGMYVRALIRDLGERLGVGGCLTSLVRRSVGPFEERDAWSISALSAAGGPDEYLIPIDRARQLLGQDSRQLVPAAGDHVCG